MTVDSAHDLLYRLRAHHNVHAKPLTRLSRDLRRRELRRHVRLEHKYEDHPNIELRPIHVPVECDGVIP